MNEIVKPKLQVLTKKQANIIHQYSLKILANTGIKVECKKAREIFIKSGAVKVKGNKELW